MVKKTINYFLEKKIERNGKTIKNNYQKTKFNEKLKYY